MEVRDSWTKIMSILVRNSHSNSIDHVSLYEEQCKWCTNERKAIEKEAKTKYAYNEKKLISNGSIDIASMYQPYRFWTVVDGLLLELDSSYLSLWQKSRKIWEVTWTTCDRDWSCCVYYSSGCTSMDMGYFWSFQDCPITVRPFGPTVWNQWDKADE